MARDINLNLFLSKLCKCGGFILIILGVIAICIRLPDGVIPISLGIAFFAIGISYESADRMKAIANTNFLQVVNMFEDVRVFFISGLYDVETFTWKSLSHIEMATELLKEDKKKHFIEKKHQDKIVKYFKISMETFFQKHTWTNVENSQRSNIVRAYYLLQDFYKENITEENLTNVFNTNLNRDERNDFEERLRNMREDDQSKGRRKL